MIEPLAIAGSGNLQDLLNFSNHLKRYFDQLLAGGCAECGSKPAHGTVGCLNCNKTIPLCQSCHDKKRWMSAGDEGFVWPNKLECHHQ